MIFLTNGVGNSRPTFYVRENVLGKKQATGNERMQEISKAIKEGALAFLNAEYRLLFIFVVIASGALFGISQCRYYKLDDRPSLYLGSCIFRIGRKYWDENCYRSKC